MSVSLDGIVESADGDISWDAPDEELHEHFNDRECAIDIHLYGRGMYGLMSAYWPAADENPVAPEVEKEYACLWRGMPKIVFSRTYTQVRWNASLVRDTIAAVISRLKERPVNNLSVCGPGLASSFMQLRLIDEYWLYLDPVILGAGKPLFPRLNGKVVLK